MDGDSLRDTIVWLYNRLDVIARLNHEFGDTDVRQSIHETLSFFFVWGRPLTRAPRVYSMFSEEADRAIAEAIEDSVREATAIADRLDLRPEERLAALQDSTVTTIGGLSAEEMLGRVYELGRSPECIPDYRFEAGDYEDE